MFFAVSRFASGPVELTVGMAFERRFRLFAVNRRGLTFDTRFAPPIASASSAVMVYLILEGALTWDGTRTFRGPTLLVMRESDFEGENGRRHCWLSSSGTPYATVELRIPPADCLIDLGSGPVDIALDAGTDPLVAAARLYLHASHGKAGQERTVDLAAAYIEQLHARRVLRTPLASTITRDEGARELIWSALRPSVERFGNSVSQDRVALAVGWSTQRLQREIARLADAFGITWLGRWRDVAHRYRVRVATLLLSAPSLSVSEVARIAGYSSVEALAHALDGFGLPSPSEVRRLLAEGATTSGPAAAGALGSS